MTVKYSVHFIMTTMIFVKNYLKFSQKNKRILKIKSTWNYLVIQNSSSSTFQPRFWTIKNLYKI